MIVYLQKLVNGKNKIILTSLVFCLNTLNILTRSHLSSHLLVVLAKLKPTPNKTNLAAQSKYIYIYIYIYVTQEAIKPENKQNKTAMIVSRVASESIRNMNETEDSNKNRNKNMQNDETTPKYVGYDENKLQETKTTERKRISKVDAKQTRF